MSRDMWFLCPETAHHRAHCEHHRPTGLSFAGRVRRIAVLEPWVRGSALGVSLRGMEQTRFLARRAAFMEQLGDTIAVIPAGKMQVRNDDVEHAFRQNSDFFFLTGFSEPDSIAVFDPSHATQRYTLFVRPRDPELEAWNGRRAGTEGAEERFGADAAYTLDAFDTWLFTQWTR
jgi:hypothetical protein